jgi:RAT1-interacting protein
MKRHSESEGSDGGGSSDKQLKSVDVIRAPISEPNVHDKKFPFFRRPRIIGSFSVDANRKFVPDRSQMRFFCPERLKNSAQAGSSYKKVNWDLNDGYDKVIRKDESFKKDEGISFMLKWICHNKSAFQIIDQTTNEAAPLTTLSTDFVAFRGLLTTIMV